MLLFGKNTSEREAAPRIAVPVRKDRRGKTCVRLGAPL
jgi:hypothetical protein